MCIRDRYKVTELGFARTFQNIRLFRRMTVLDNVLIGMHTRTKTNLLTAIFNTRAKRKEMEECEKKAVDLPVSYTHLDLYKRQPYREPKLSFRRLSVLLTPMVRRCPCSVLSGMSAHGGDSGPLKEPAVSMFSGLFIRSG